LCLLATRGRIASLGEEKPEQGLKILSGDNLHSLENFLKLRLTTSLVKMAIFIHGQIYFFDLPGIFFLWYHDGGDVQCG